MWTLFTSHDGQVCVIFHGCFVARNPLGHGTVTHRPVYRTLANDNMNLYDSKAEFSSHENKKKKTTNNAFCQTAATIYFGKLSCCREIILSDCQF